MLSSAPLKAIFFTDFKNAHIPEILQEIYIKQVYRPFVEGRTDMIIMDAGANIGLFSFYASQYAKKVYALEPSMIHVPAMNALFESNKIENVKILPMALSNENGTTRFYHNDNVTMFSMEEAVSDKGEYEDVITATIDKIFDTEKIDHIDLLKLDIEGSEGKFIASEGFAKIAPKIAVIVGEWHSWCSMSKDLFMNTFRDLGYEFTWFKGTDASVFQAIRFDEKPKKQIEILRPPEITPEDLGLKSNEQPKL